MPGIEKREFISLFNEMFQPIKNYVYYKVGDIEVAEDIAQDTFTKMWEKRREIRQSTMKSLLYTIANNLCKNRFEHQQVVFEFANNYDRNQWDVSPEFEMELKEFNTKLQNGIDGYTYNEIADNLGISVKAVEKRMKNALTDLKKTIKHKF
jgi:RNA polymerase sigma-70 factor (ECF subfamily)